MKFRVTFGSGQAPANADSKFVEFVELRRNDGFTDFYDVRGALVYSVETRRVASIERISDAS